MLDSNERVSESLSFSQLDHRAASLAAELSTLLSPGSRVLLLYPQGLEFLSAFLACLYAGGVAVPAYPPRSNHHLARLRALVADCDAAAVLTLSSQLDKVRGKLRPAQSREPHYLCSDTLATRPSAHFALPPAALDPAALAFLQYTSGSTGDPKGVQITHRNILINCADLDEPLAHEPTSAMVSWLPAFHDMGLIYGLLLPIFKGFPCTLMAPVSFVMRPMRWLRALSERQATHAAAPNFAYDLCVEKVSPEEVATLDLSRVRALLNGAEPIRAATVRRFLQHFAPAGLKPGALAPGYGLAEGTLKICLTSVGEGPRILALSAAALSEGRVVPHPPEGQAVVELVGCGRCSGLTRLAIADPQGGQRLAPDRVGEIWIAGPTLAAGYWMRPELTHERFQAHLEDGDGPYFRSGDLGFVHEGQLYVAGRLKELIICQGRNHYPKDLEQLVEAAHPALKENGSAAFAVEGPDGEGVAIVSELRRKSLGRDEASAIFAAIRQALAEGPGLELQGVALIRPGSLARTSSGKIQRGACRSAYLAGELEPLAQFQSEPRQSRLSGPALLDLEALRHAPTHERQLWLNRYLVEQLEGLFPKLAGAIDPTRPLCEYVPDSMQVLDFEYRLQRGLGLGAQAELALERLSLAELGEQLLPRLFPVEASETRGPAEPASAAVATDATDSDANEFALSLNQRALWFLQQLESKSTAYHLAAALIFRPRLDPERVKEVLNRLMARHLSLRMGFYEIEGEPRIRLFASEQPPLHCQETLPPAPAADGLAEHADRPFDLAERPAWDLTLFATASQSDETLALLRFHHIISDLWSIEVFMEEFELLYRDLDEPLPAAPAYSAFTAAQRRYLEGPEAAADLGFWQQRLANPPPPLRFLSAPARPARPGFSGDRLGFSLPGMGRQLQELASRLGLSPFTLLMTAYQIWLRLETGASDLIVGFANHGRPGPEWERSFGYFVNPLPLRIQSEDSRFLELARLVDAGLQEARRHDRLPLARLLESLRLERSAGHSPLFQTMLGLQRPLRIPELVGLSLVDERARLELGRFELELLPLKRRAAQFDIGLFFAERGEDLYAWFEYNDRLFEAARIEGFRRRFSEILRLCLLNPNLEERELRTTFAEPICEKTAESDGSQGGAPAPVRIPTADQPLAPSPSAVPDERESALAELWSELLHRAPIKKDDDFFLLGGHSLLAVKLSALVRKRLGLELPLASILESTRLGEMAAQLHQAGKREPDRSEAALDRGIPFRLLTHNSPQDAPAPLEPTQAQIWLHEMMHPNGARYNVPCAWLLEGELEPEALCGALEAALYRHPVLRSRFGRLDGEPRQWLADPQLPLERGQLPEQDLAHRLQAFYERGFALAEQPPWRVALWQIGVNRHILCLVFHHLILDAHSLDLFLAELSQDYLLLLRGAEARALGTAETRPSYFEFVVKSLKHTSSTQASTAEQAWLDHLRGLKAPALPYDFHSEATEGPGQARPIALGAESAARLDALARSCACSPFTLYLAAIYAALAHWCGERDLALATAVSRRTEPEWERVLGLFIQVLPIRIDSLSLGEASPRQLLASVQRIWRSVQLRQQFPLPLHELQRHGISARSWLWFTLGYSENSGQAFELTGLRTREQGFQSKDAKTELSISLRRHGDGELTGYLEYRSDRFSDANIERLVQRFHWLLERFATSPDSPLALMDRHILALPVRAAAPAPELATGPSEPSGLLQRFDAHVAEAPEAIALEFIGQAPEAFGRLSHAQLADWSHRLAARLAVLDLPPCAPIGVSLPHGPGLCAAIVAIWRLGHCYVPLEIKLPAQRLERLASEAGIRAWIAEPKTAAPTASLAALPRLAPEAEPVLEAEPEPSLRPKYPPHLEGACAYLVFTSGSTGQPKGVRISHASYRLVLAHFAQQFGLGRDSRLLQFAPIGFDPSLFEIGLALWSGACFCHAQAPDLLPGPPLAASLRRGKITHVASVLASFALTPADNLPDLRSIALGGERMRGETVEQWGRGRALWNLYGPSETTIACTFQLCEPAADGRITDPPIGRELPCAALHLLDQAMRPAASGEIYIGGPQVGLGYTCPVRTAAAFLPDPFSSEPGMRLYRSGDRARRLDNGSLEFLGRHDEQVKFRGHRIELGEIAAALCAQPGVADACVQLVFPGPTARLIAWIRPNEGAPLPDVQPLLDALRKCLPHDMLPAEIQALPLFPLTSNGKTDGAKLRRDYEAQHASAELPADPLAASKLAPTALIANAERLIAAIWRELTGRAAQSDANFFDSGGHSLLLVKLQERLEAQFGRSLDLVALYRYPRIADQARLVLGLATADSSALPVPAQPASSQPLPTSTSFAVNPLKDEAVAVIGIGLRLPDADSPQEFWRNLREGRHSVRRFQPEQLEGVPPELASHPAYVPAAAVLDGIEAFDASFFGFTPAEARLLDPQQRIFLECAWEALERAGQAVGGARLNAGVFAGVGLSTYFLNQLLTAPELASELGRYQAVTFNDKDFVATQTAYRLNLAGPALSVQTACSSSLVAVHLARRALLNCECDLALAGGSTVRVPQNQGYLYREGMIMASDGVCRPYAAGASGTVGGNGAGVVVLKRLSDAIRDGDPLLAVIRGSATNNDGADKQGFTAPGQDGQIAVIRAALADAGAHPESIGYVEGHGTGTELGDPIEVAALSEAWGSQLRGFCALGSVKGNLGHLDSAAGVVGLIKTILALAHGEIPPSLHLEQVNPRIGIEATPFRAAQRLEAWPAERPLAAVSSFGIGGTNAHLILERAPTTIRPSQPRPQPPPLEPGALPLVLSARSQAALAIACSRLADWCDERLSAEPAAGFAEFRALAWTLGVGRARLPFRTSRVSSDLSEAARVLREEAARLRATPESAPQGSGQRRARLLNRVQNGNSRLDPVLLFPGQGSLWSQDSARTWAGFPVYLAWAERLAGWFHAASGEDPLPVLLGEKDARAWAERGQGLDTRLEQPLLFCFQYAFAAQLTAFGVRPAAVAGHSLGEWTAAAVAELVPVKQALELVIARARAMAATAPGAMLAVSAGEAELVQLIENWRQELRLGLYQLEPEAVDVEIAALNGPRQSVVAGRHETLTAFAEHLRRQGRASQWLNRRHAFHSRAMEPAVESLAGQMALLQSRKPLLPFWSACEARPMASLDGSYWLRQLRAPVRFADLSRSLLEAGLRLAVEAGPGRVLASQFQAAGEDLLALTPLTTEGDARTALMDALGVLASCGTALNWRTITGEQTKLILPTHAFTRERHWLPTGPGVARQAFEQAQATAQPAPRPRDPSGFSYLASWRKVPFPAAPTSRSTPSQRGPAPSLLVFGSAMTRAFVAAERSGGRQVVQVELGHPYRESGDDLFLNPRDPEDWRRLAEQVPLLAEELILAWPWSEPGATAAERAAAVAHSEALLGELARRRESGNWKLTVWINGLANPLDEALDPEKALLMGPLQALAAESPRLRVQIFDLDGFDLEGKGCEYLKLLAAQEPEFSGDCLALRGRSLWRRQLERVALTGPAPALPRSGVFLITGGLGGIGLSFARELARRAAARLVLVGRSPLPARPAQANPQGAAEGAEAERIWRGLDEIESLGGSWSYRRGDVADASFLSQLRQEILTEWAPLAGLIHTAGASQGGLLMNPDPLRRAANHSAKVDGARALRRVFANPSPGWVLLCGSLATIGDGFGQGDYIGANCFLEAFAHDWAEEGLIVRTLAWDSWRRSGMAQRSGVFQRMGADWGIEPAEGVELGLRALAETSAAQPVWYISAQELANQGAKTGVQGAAIANEPSSFPPQAQLPAQPPTQETEQGSPPSEALLAAVKRGERAAIRSYVAAVWRAALGRPVEDERVHLFELGGNSLTALEITARLQDGLGRGLSRAAIFERLSMAGIGDYLAEFFHRPKSEPGTGQGTEPGTAPEPEGASACLPAWRATSEREPGLLAQAPPLYEEGEL